MLLKTIHPNEKQTQNKMNVDVRSINETMNLFQRKMTLYRVFELNLTYFEDLGGQLKTTFRL